MRTLKKSLALVLVVALVLSFGVIGASASDFTDTTDSNYTEAIDVLSGIGVINGMTATTFEPTGSLTRAQAAKIVAYMLLGPTNAELIGSASSQKFSDVPTTHWAAGYIEYCANIGVIAGVGDNKFDPEGKLTTAAFTKMLLVALGYNASTEGFTGESWAIKVAAMAVKAGLTDDGIVMSATTVVTREQAAQLAFLALTAKTVEYKTSGTTIITSDGTQVVTAGSTYSYVVGSTAVAANYDGETGDGYAQFCEEHFPKLKLNADDTDMFGAPASTWSYSGTEISSVADEATFTYTAKTSETAMTKALKGYTLTGGSVTPVVNGKTAGVSAVTALAGIDDLTGNGTVVKIYATNKVITDIVVVSYGFGAVTLTKTAATKSHGAYTTYTVDTNKSGKVYSSVVDEDTELDTAEISGTVASGDKVLYNVITNAAGNEVVYLYIYEPETVSGALTKISSSGVFTIGGENYSQSSAANAVAPAAVSSTSGTYYVDNYGYLVAVKSASTSSNFGLVISKDTYSVLKDGKIVTEYSAVIAKTDGTVETLETDEDSYTGESAVTVGTVVSYTYDSTDEVYNLSTAAAATDSTATVKVSAVTAITKASNTLTVANSAVLAYANSNTKFVKVDFETNSKGVRVPTGTVTIYTGVANVPNFSSLTAAFAVDTTSATNSDTVADVVYIYDDVAATASDTYVYVPGTYSLTSSGYEVNAFVAGEETTLTIKDLTSDENDDLVAGGLFSAVTVTSGVADVTEASGAVQAVINNGGLLFTGSTVAAAASTGYALPSDTPVYYIDTTEGTSTTGTAADLTSGYLCPTTLSGNDAGIFYVLGSGTTANTVIAMYILYA